MDRNCRQTGFQSNSGTFGGVVNFDYYGVVFDPKLSNLQVFTAGIGVRPLRKSSVDGVYHHYIIPNTRLLTNSGMLTLRRTLQVYPEILAMRST